MASPAPPPPEFLCPVSLEVMDDPVFTADDQTFDRASIQKWFDEGKRTSPLTGRRLDNLTLRPNRILKALIDGWKNGGSAPPVPGPDVPTTQAAQQPPPPPPTAPQLGVRFAHDPSRDGLAVVSVLANPGTNSLPAHIILVLDVSGSMQAAAADKGDGARLTRLDLVKHSTMAVAELMRAQDELTVLTFSDAVKRVITKRKMDASGKADAKRCVACITTEGSTDMYLGIREALSIAGSAPNPRVFTHVVVLTDGQPSYSPPMGFAETVRRDLVGKDAVLSCIAYGMGNDIDSKLMADIARVGGGAFRYVPDASVTGTVMIHLVANSLNVAAKDVRVKFRSGEQHVLKIVPTDAPASFFHQHLDTCTELEFYGSSAALPPVLTEEEDLGYEAGRVSFLMVLNDAVRAPLDPVHKAKLVSLSESFAQSADERLQRLGEDIHSPGDENKGQITKALDAWEKWGRHYLPAILSAHDRRERASFKEASMKNYGGENLAKLVDEGERAFVRLPPPQAHSPPMDRDGGGPSLMAFSATRGGPIALGATRGATRGGPGLHRSFQTLSMGSLMSASAGCFAPDAYVLEKTRGYVPIADVRKNDVLLARDDVWATVAIAVHFPPHEVELCNRPGITPYHPILSEEAEWVFPRDDFNPDLRTETTPVYNLVMVSEHVVDIYAKHEEGFMFAYTAVTLAHEFKGPVVGHKYFGSEACLRDLAKFEGFHEGLVHVPAEAVWVRDAVDNTVVGLRVPEKDGAPA